MLNKLKKSNGIKLKNNINYERKIVMRMRLLLIFHKPLKQGDGQTNYLKGLINVMSQQYDIEIPSEIFYNTFKVEKKNWILRTLLVNIYLCLWVIKNRKKVRTNYALCIMEDRYSVIPTFFLIKITKIKLLARISDWGIGYVETLNFEGRFPTFIARVLDKFYTHFVLRNSKGAIVPSDYIHQLMQKNFKKPI